LGRDRSYAREGPLTAEKTETRQGCAGAVLGDPDFSGIRELWARIARLCTGERELTHRRGSLLDPKEALCSKISKGKWYW
jgi:hypothetical protein